MRSVTPYRSLTSGAVAFFLITVLTTESCVKGQGAADTSDPGFPFSPTPLSTQPPTPIAYVQDIKPIFDRDCLSCHSSFNARAGYSVSTYQETMSGQRPGDAKSTVVVDCSPGGSMYTYFSGDAITEATLVFRWMVVYKGQETR